MSNENEFKIWYEKQLKLEKNLCFKIDKLNEKIKENNKNSLLKNKDKLFNYLIYMNKHVIKIQSLLRRKLANIKVNKLKKENINNKNKEDNNKKTMKYFDENFKKLGLSYDKIYRICNINNNNSINFNLYIKEIEKLNFKISLEYIKRLESILDENNTNILNYKKLIIILNIYKIENENWNNLNKSKITIENQCFIKLISQLNNNNIQINDFLNFLLIDEIQDIINTEDFYNFIEKNKYINLFNYEKYCIINYLDNNNDNKINKNKFLKIMNSNYQYIKNNLYYEKTLILFNINNKLSLKIENENQLISNELNLTLDKIDKEKNIINFSIDIINNIPFINENYFLKSDLINYLQINYREYFNEKSIDLLNNKFENEIGYIKFMDFLKNFSEIDNEFFEYLIYLFINKINFNKISFIKYFEKVGINKNENFNKSTYFRLIIKNHFNMNEKQSDIFVDLIENKTQNINLFKLIKFLIKKNNNKINEEDKEFLNNFENNDNDININNFELIILKLIKNNDFKNIKWLFKEIIENFELDVKEIKIITLKDILKNKFSELLNNKEIDNLIFYLDTDENKLIDLNEIFNFLKLGFKNIHNYKDKKIELQLNIISFILEKKNIKTEDFLIKNGFINDSILYIEEFTNLISLSIGIDKEDIEDIFYFLSSNGNNIEFNTIIETINNLRINKPIKRIKKIENIENDDNEFDLKSINNIINEIESTGLNACQFFSMADKNKNNNITLEELKNVFSLFIDKDLNKLSNFFKTIDINGDGTINKNEFQVFFMNKKKDLNYIKNYNKEIKNNLKNNIENQLLIKIDSLIKEKNIKLENLINELDYNNDCQIPIFNLFKYLKNNINEIDINDIIKVINILDKNKNGFISNENLSILFNLNKLDNLNFIIDNIKETNKEILKLNKNLKIFFKKADLDNDNRINVLDIKNNINLLIDNNEKLKINWINNLVNFFGKTKFNFESFNKFLKNDLENIILKTFEEKLSYLKSNELEIFKEFSINIKNMKQNKSFNIKKEIIKFDNNNDGILQIDEFVNFLKNNIKNINNDKISIILSVANKDNNDIIDYEEFFDFVTNGFEILIKNNITNNNNNYFEKSIKKLLNFINKKEKLGQNLDEIISSFDINNDNHINFKEFSKILENINLKNLNEQEKLSIFKKIDFDDKHLIQLDIFKNFIISQKKKFNENINKEKLDVEEINYEIDIGKNLKEYLSKIKIDPKKDYFMGKKTILNSYDAALKQAINLINEMKKNKNKYFLDEDFGPNKFDPNGKNSIYFDKVLQGYPNPEEIEWLYPHEICKDKTPVFLKEGAESNDAIQGTIGNCWFIGALSVLATQDYLIRGNFNPTEENIKEIDDEKAFNMLIGVFPPIFHFLSQYNLYIFRFFKNYNWRYVIIDSKLPCIKSYMGYELIFGKCNNKDEFWVPLIEKAYAKIHNKYEALISGFVDDGLYDMTGLVSEKVYLKKFNKFNQTDLISEEIFWEKLKNNIKNKTMMGISVNGDTMEGEYFINNEPTGIICRHAYSLLDAIEIKNEDKIIKLLRIRNPWGSANPIEWNGRYSDGTLELKKNLDIINENIKMRWGDEAEIVHEKLDDGTFLMEYSDFLIIWDNLYLSINFPDEYTGIRCFGNWNEENSGGLPNNSDPNSINYFFKNDKFFIKINNKNNNKTNLFFSLGQNDGRLDANRDNIFPFPSNLNPIIWILFKINSEEDLHNFSLNNIIKKTTINTFREISINTNLESGLYIWLPSTKEFGQYGDYVLNIYYDCNSEDVMIKSINENYKFETIEEEDELIKKYDETFKLALKENAKNVIF